MESILKLAWELGYYEKKVYIKDIAAEVGWDEKTVRKHLRREERRAIQQYLEDESPEDLKAHLEREREKVAYLSRRLKEVEGAD